MIPEDQLLARLEDWLAAQPKPPTIFDVIATRDGELFAAYVLKGFRVAARQAVLDRIEHEESTASVSARRAAASAPIRVFLGLAEAWSLDQAEMIALLGLTPAEDIKELCAAPAEHLSTEIIERIIILLDVFQAVNTLLPQSDRADAWLRAPNGAPLFGGRSALGTMIAEGLQGLRDVRAYLQAQVRST